MMPMPVKFPKTALIFTSEIGKLPFLGKLAGTVLESPNVMNWFWLLVVWAMMFWGLRYGLTVILLTRSRFAHMSGSVVPSDRVPEYLRDLFKIAALDLDRLGFRDCGYIQYSPFQRIHPAVRWMQVLVDPSGTHFVTIELRYPATAIDPFSVTFHTWCDDGHLLLTVDRLAYAILEPIPNTTVGDTRIRNLDRQWDYHQQQFADISKHRDASNLDISGFSDRYFAHFAAYVDRLIATKVFIPGEDGSHYRRPLIKAFEYAYRLIYHRPKPQPLAQPIDLPPEVTIDNARMLEQSQTSTSSRRSKFGFFGISAIAFYVAIIPYMGWELGTQLAIIILLHELGHLLAMQLFGYRNTSMLFIPFFGGVAMGKNEQATLSQKFWVLMLGPLPGILLGLVMLFTSQGSSSWLWNHGFGLWMVGINLLNLLPIYPLDGGKIVGLLLQPYPYISIGFKLICTVLSIGLGLFGAPLFLLIGIAIALSLPVDLRTARAITKLRQQPGAADLTKDEWFKWAASQLDASSQAPVKLAHQKLFMTNLWEWRSDLHNAAGVRWGLGLLYTVALIGGTIGSTYGLVGNILPIVASSYLDDFQTQSMNPTQRKAYYRTKWQRDLRSTTATIERDPNNIKAYRQQLRLHRLLKDDRGAMADLDRLIAIKPDPRYLYERLSLHQQLQQYSAALLDTDRLLQLNPQSKSYLHQTRGDLYTKLGKIDLAIASYTTQLLEVPTASRYSAYLERSKLYTQKGEQKLALADLDLAIASEPKYATAAYFERAKLRDLAGDVQGATLDRQQATAIEAKNLDDDRE
jgi:tetratricopeptide (TPR) repeat protein/Zn-dependent protease